MPQRAACFVCQAVLPNGLERWPKHDPLARAVPGTAHLARPRSTGLGKRMFFCRRIAKDGRESAARCFVFARELVCMTLFCFRGARERACCARFCFFLLLVQVFDHLAWNIMSTSFDLKLDPPNSKCYLILYPSYKYFDIILLLLYLFLIFILNRF
jgi:hypothetical protein